MPVEASVLTVLDAASQGKLGEVKKSFSESDGIVFTVYALPVPRLKIRTASKRLVELDEGKLQRLEYSLFRSLITAAAKGGKPRFQDFAVLVGDYKAAAAYISYMWRLGLVLFEDHDKALQLYMAANSLSQKRYERSVARALDAVFTINREALEKLEKDKIACIYQEESIYCRYIVSHAERFQAKAQVRAVADSLAEA